MTKRQTRNDVMTLVEWLETSARSHLEMASARSLNAMYSKQYVRGLKFKAKRLAQCAMMIRRLAEEVGEKP